MPTDDRLWTQKDVAEFLGVTTKTVQSLPIPRVNMNIARVRYLPETVREWARRQQTAT